MHLSPRWKRGAAVAALATIGLLGVAGTGADAAPAAQINPVCTTPLKLSFVGLTHTEAGPAIRVRGIKPYSTTNVDLIPEDVVYVHQPDYWNYFIVGCGGSGPVTKVAFDVVLPIDGPVGKYGIAIGGLTFDLPGLPAGPATS